MYKALIIDLDGTAIPNRRDGMPSERVVNAVKKAKEKVVVCAATGRGIDGCREIIRSLGLASPCILSGGTRVFDPVNEKVLWEKGMEPEQIDKIMEIALQYQYPVFFTDDEEGILPKYRISNRGERIIYIEPVTPRDADIILKQLEKIPGIAVHKVMSWVKGQIDIHITHAEATKRHALEILLGILKINKEEVVAVGDSDNDLPLFELAGYKVAMGNGSESLKKSADLVAPSVDEDGLAVVIEKMFT